MRSERILLESKKMCAMKMLFWHDKLPSLHAPSVRIVLDFELQLAPQRRFSGVVMGNSRVCSMG